MRAARAASYTEFQCRSHEGELETATLFARTVGVLERTFAAIAIRPCPELEKARVLLLPRGGGVVSVLHGNEEIACIAPGDTDPLAQAIADEPLCAGRAVAVIEQASSITPELVLRLVDHAKDSGEDDDE